MLPPAPPGPTPPETEEEPAPADEVAAAPGVIPEPPGEPDDLRRLEGIGPKVEGALHGLGIKTYAQLAAADPVVLEQQIRDAGVRVLPGAPETWPEQAALAAKRRLGRLRTAHRRTQGRPPQEVAAPGNHRPATPIRIPQRDRHT